MERPRLGDLQLLVYRECPCGNWCATGENSTAPKCEACDGYFVPGGGPRDGEPMFGRDRGEAMRMRRLGFIAFLTVETGAVRTLARLRKLLGLVTDDVHYLTRAAPDDRLLYESEATQASDEIKEANADG